jgi:hypothetical protein
MQVHTNLHTGLSSSSHSHLIPIFSSQYRLILISFSSHSHLIFISFSSHSHLISFSSQESQNYAFPSPASATQTDRGVAKLFSSHVHLIPITFSSHFHLIFISFSSPFHLLFVSRNCLFSTHFHPICISFSPPSRLKNRRSMTGSIDGRSMIDQ